MEIHGEMPNLQEMMLGIKKTVKDVLDDMSIHPFKRGVISPTIYGWRELWITGHNLAGGVEVYAMGINDTGLPLIIAVSADRIDFSQPEDSSHQEHILVDTILYSRRLHGLRSAVTLACKIANNTNLSSLVSTD